MMIRLLTRPVGRLALLAGAAGMVVSMFAGEATAQQSVARRWDEQMLAAIRLDKPRPPVHARNLYHTSVCMWDAWAAYDTRADQVMHHERATPPAGYTVEQARAEAISYAAYRMIKWRYMNAFGSATTLPRLDNEMAALGYDINNTSVVGNTPAALGNRIYETVRSTCLIDGGNEPANYAPNNGYLPVNPPLIIALEGTSLVNPNHWQPLAFDYFINQNGIPEGAIIQAFVCPHWDGVTPFGLRRTNPNDVYIDPGPPPQLGVGSPTDAAYKADFVANIELSARLDPNDGVTIDISPAAKGNNPLGTNDGTGYALNPATGQPYQSHIVKRADYGRVIAEFWADGPDSETPPGHWNVLANQVSDNPLTVKRIRGTGPIVNNLEWDVKTYLAINGAVHDAAVVAWGLKGKYDGVRPISAIRYMGQTGQSSDTGQPSYNPDGLPLIPGLIELVTNETIQPGQRHESIPDRDQMGVITNAHIGEVAIRSWRGQPPNPATQIGGVGWILAKRWKTYQKTTFVTPPFAGYISGHSTFSRSAAEVMTKLTGSAYFPGGLATFTARQNAFLTFEMGPTTDVTLQWATYYDAADDAGISRIYGSIHPPSDDFAGRIAGSQVGKTAWAVAERYFGGRISCPGDWNGSGEVTVQDIFDFLAAYFAGDADMNLDGVTSVQDIFDYLTAYFTSCA